MTAPLLVLGIDPGLASVGVAIVEHPTRRVLFTKTIHTYGKRGDVPRRLDAIATALWLLQQTYHAPIIGYESNRSAMVGQYLRGKGNATMLDVSACVGLIHGLGAGSDVVPVSTADARSCVGCLAGADERTVAAAVRRLCPGVPVRCSTHAIDAITVAIAAGRFVAGASRARADRGAA